MVAIEEQDSPADVLHIGGQTITIEEAEKLVHNYLHHGDGGYAYPAYDYYQGGPPDQITDGDLLAPALLNAGPSIAAFERLQEQRDRLEHSIQQLRSDIDLIDANDKDIRLVGACYAVLDDPGLPGIRGTKLSKILHRKRPNLIPLFDSNVSHCYQDGEDAPIPHDPNRSWQDFMTALAYSMREDLRGDQATWERLCHGPRGPVTLVRCLDIVAWQLGGRQPEPVESEDLAPSQ